MENNNISPPENRENDNNSKQENSEQCIDQTDSQGEKAIKNQITSDENSETIQIIRQKNSQMNYKYDYLFKIALIGDSGIGKSSILIRFTDNDFREDTNSTIGVDFKIVSIYLGNDKYAKMQIWDTCGSERFKSLTASFIKSCPAFLLIFDITKFKTFINLENWLNIIKDNTNPKLLCLIGNKSDLEEHRQVPREAAIQFAEKHGLKYMETSAKTNDNVEKVFTYVAQSLYKEVVKRNSEMFSGSSGGLTFEIGGFKNIRSERTNQGNSENEQSNSRCC